MSNLNTAAYWDEVYTEEIQELIRMTNNYDLRWQLDRFEKIASLMHRSSGKVLDVGCGLGNLTRYLKARDPYLDVYGVDFSKVAVDFCNEHIPNHYFVSNADDLSNFEEFDVIISSETIEHLDNPKAHLQSIYDLLKLDGSVIISTPNFNQSDNGEYVSHEHVHEFTPIELEKLMEEVGFKSNVSVTPNTWWMCVMGTKKL